MQIKASISSFAVLLIILSIIFGIICGTPLLSQISQRFDKNDPNKITRLSPTVTKQHVILPTIGQEIYLVPPDANFEKTNKNFLGFISEKYNSTIRISFAISSMPDDYNMVASRYEILEFEELQINDMSARFYKLRTPGSNDINWLLFCKSDFYHFYIMTTYDKRYDNQLAVKIKKTMRSIIVKRNPDVMPWRNTSADADYDLLQPLKFVKLMTFPICYFTEDSLPIDITRGGKYATLVTPPTSVTDLRDISEIAISTVRSLLAVQQRKDTIIPERMEEVTFITDDNAICMEGSLTQQTNKRFIAYFTKDTELSYLVYAACNEEDADAFFPIIRKFAQSVRKREDFLSKPTDEQVKEMRERIKVENKR